jgi:hypothetical protein
LHEEAIELRFRQRISPFLFQGVLRGENVKRRREGMIVAGDGYPVLLHRLQQCRLRARARAIDLVGHQ